MPKPEQFVQVDLGTLENSCFVIMPFAGAFNTVYERVIRPAVEEAGLFCVRADEVFSKPQITHDIWKQIRSCRIIVAELTRRNPNVLYELGLAHAIGKPVVIITRNETDVPFDLKALRYLFYDVDDPFWGDTLKKSLADMCLKVIGTSDFGTVLEGIRIPEDVKFNEIASIPKTEIPLFDLTGVWHGTANYEALNQSNTWVVQLIQNGTILNGNVVSTSIIGGEIGVVNESLTGEIIGVNVKLHGSAYSYLHQGKSGGYVLDILEGDFMSDGTEIQGSLSVEGNDDSLGMILLKKEEFVVKP